ncbi:MAG TPA: Swarming motility protein SwrC, partial [Exiguobacterium sp.]|nr:Swarming motility protein SwrC [Exiguobacterium sp.]
MKKIIQFSVNNKFALWLMTIIITVAGIYAGTSMKLETLPDITTPTVSVTTIYPGATPEQVLDEVSRELESKVENLPGVDTVRSTSFQNASNLQIDYNFSTDMEEAEQKVKEALSNVELPEGVQEPQVSRISFDAFPVIGFAVSDKERSLSELTKLVENELQPKLEGIEGAQTVQVAGQEIRRIEIRFDEKKLERYGLTEENAKQLIQANDSRLALGLYELGDKEQAVVLDGKATTVKELKDLRLPYTPPVSNTPEAGQAGQ